MKTFLTEDFDAIASAAWKQKIQFELNGADYQNTLMTPTNEGITIKPFYHLDDFEKLHIPATEKAFKICQEIIITSESTTNQKAIDAIEGGADSLKFRAKKPFNISVQQLMTKISYSIFYLWLLAILHNIHVQFLAKRHDFSMELFSSDFIFLAGIIFIFAQIVKRGIEIQQENDLTI